MKEGFKDMEIRKATEKDLIHIVRSLQNKGIDYNTTKQAKEDLRLNRLFVAVDNEKVIGSCAVVPEEKHGYTAIKRLCIYNKKNCGKGIASQLIKYICALDYERLGATPWDNPPVIKLLEKNGFKYQYTFLEKYNFYLRENLS